MTYTDQQGIVHEPQASDYRKARPIEGGSNDREWYKRAVFYEVLVRAFADSNGDGTGDLRGLIDKLDYLAWLGVDCLWLPPFYDSPLRDGGYDISDYRKVLPEFGTVDDFVALLDAAHERGIRVIVDLVMNHTSDAHQWFQESRRHPDGPYGDYYVWRDDDTGYPDARIIFVDTEPSNWTFDPVRKQYFWHRFFSHQPDLNFENPAVGDEMIDSLRFWLDLGLDGFRLDAVPYLFEEEGTNGENLPKTHEFLKRCRKVLDVEYPNAILLAEANQWPADVVDYFGDPEVGGDECHMCFHFPLMPRIFMAARREQRFPISEILAQTPAIPESGQWGIFLRNHDELTLEMVSDEDRDYMWNEYAKDPRMKANIGIRRRLATLLENDTNQQELFTAMLLSLPGSPVLYYGDEIGMGDNIWLGDRDGVRTPMQWSPDRNAGFSRCDPARLYLPAIMDPIYGFQTVNVEAQMNSTASLLHWTRRMIEIRKRYAAFSVGQFTDLGGSNPTVLSYTLDFDGDTGGIKGPAHTMLCVNNLSRFPQPVELDLRDHIDAVPIELTGATPFPRIGQLPYLLTLPGHGFYWFDITGHQDGGATMSPVAAQDHDLVPLLAEYLPHQRWFAAKGIELDDRDIAITHRTLVAENYWDADIEQVLFTVVTPSGTHRYQIWIGWTWQVPDRLAHAVIGAVDGRTAYDALSDVNVSRLLLESIDQGRDFGDGLVAIREQDAKIDTGAEGLVIGAEQSNTSIVYGHTAILKMYRRLEPGPNPDAEIHRALRAVGSVHIAEALGEFVGDVDGERTTLGLLTEFFANSAEGWAMATSSVRDLMSEGDLRADEVGGDFASEAFRLGEAVAAVHADLARAFGTNTAPHDELARILDGMRAEANTAADLVPSLSEHRAAILLAFDRASDHAAGINVQRIHGDLHLGQVLRTLNGWSIIDFEGEPSKPLAYRRAMHSPLKDVAGMLRSFDYAARGLVISPHTDAQHKYRAAEWADRNRRAFCDGYAAAAGTDPRLAGSLLRAFELDKAIYEVVYEHGHRPLWEAIPLQAVVALINTGGIS